MLRAMQAVPQRCSSTSRGPQSPLEVRPRPVEPVEIRARRSRAGHRHGVEHQPAQAGRAFRARSDNSATLPQCRCGRFDRCAGLHDVVRAGAQHGIDGSGIQRHTVRIRLDEMDVRPAVMCDKLRARASMSGLAMTAKRSTTPRHMNIIMAIMPAALSPWPGCSWWSSGPGRWSPSVVAYLVTMSWHHSNSAGEYGAEPNRNSHGGPIGTTWRMCGTRTGAFGPVGPYPRHHDPIR